jgi:hypothetical protein
MIEASVLQVRKTQSLGYGSFRQNSLNFASFSFLFWGQSLFGKRFR